MLTALATIAETFTRCTTLEALVDVLSTELFALVPFGELMCDLTSFSFNRPALIRLGMDDAWTKRYNAEFFRLNPASDALKALAAAGVPAVRRFEALCAEPLQTTRFYREYMRPQGHAHSIVALSPPSLVMLLVRKDGEPAFSDDELRIVFILLPALAAALARIVRSSDDWAAAVIKHAFQLPPKLAEVALLVARGHSNQAVADELGLTLGTAKHYVHKLLEATGASSRADLCRMLLS
jgi:DNA-binding CsgD family transcriptional regulator